ncbi:Disease resistance-like protein CSA1 [Vitis vinifera]|uniref:Disease resistance-like protein CSA1 n=1 Tax=Vitis vinifera TaxID=29760 RepID=A0A438IGW2_VITVI|nr:Disease resistance-like protein CSA1 [Vitis vinifera]
MCYSLLKQLWEGKKAFEKLKFIKLSHSQHLTKTPDFSAAPKLRRIILNGCTSLVKLHPSIGALKELIFLNLEGCSKLEKFPEVVQGNLEDLSGISLEGTAIRELPSSIGGLNRLVLLNLRNCKKLASLPQSICELISLQTLTLSGCSKLKKLPDDLGRLQCLVELHVDGTGIKELPIFIGNVRSEPKQFHYDSANLSGLSRLHVLMLPYCKSLQSLPELPSSIRYLNAEACTSLETFSCSPKCMHIEEGGFIDGPHNLYDAIVPGSRIPEWFVDQSTGSSVTVELPPHWYNTKLMGMAVCAVIGATGVIDPTIEEWRPQIYFKCSSVIYQGDDAIMSRSMKDDHTWFRYLSLCWLHGRTPPLERAEALWWFHLEAGEEKLEVKKCGVRLVYEGEEKDSHCSFPCGAMLPEEREETDSECSFPGEGDESDSGSEDLRQSNSDSE